MAEGADFTSSVYALVVTASASIGLFSYVRNYYVGMFKAEVDNFLNAWAERSKKNVKFDNEATASHDKIAIQKPIDIIGPIIALCVLLPFSAAMQIYNIADKQWGLAPTKGIAALLIIFGYVVAFIAIIKTLERLQSLRKDTEVLKDEASSTLKMIDRDIAAVERNGSAGSTP